jgi:hypothetical protein
LSLIIGFCAYALWRGTFRPFWPCCASSSGQKAKEQKIDNTDGQPTDLSVPFSPASTRQGGPGPNLQFWKRKETRSGDWGHHIYLTDLKRQAEANALAKLQCGGGDTDKGSVRYDEEAVREAAAAGAGGTGMASSPKSENGGRRLRKSVGVASPLREVGHTASPGSTAHSHTHLMKSTTLNPNRPLSSTRTSSSGSPGSSLPHRAISPASTILTLSNPALPPRHTSLYSPVSVSMKGPNRFSNHGHGGSSSSSPSPLSSRNTISPYMPSSRSIAIPPLGHAQVPSVARAAYSPFAPKVHVPGETGSEGVGGELPGPRAQSDRQGQGQGQRGSVVSQRGYAV